MFLHLPAQLSSTELFHWRITPSYSTPSYPTMLSRHAIPPCYHTPLSHPLLAHPATLPCYPPILPPIPPCYSTMLSHPAIPPRYPTMLSRIPPPIPPCYPNPSYSTMLEFLAPHPKKIAKGVGFKNHACGQVIKYSPFYLNVREQLAGMAK